MGAQPAKAFQLSTVESLESVVSRALGGSRRVAESKSRRAIIRQSRYARIGGSKRSCHRTMSRGGKSSIYWTMEEVLRAWRLPPESLHLKMDEVHVWGVQLTHLSTEIREFYDQLAPDERRRAESFHFERDRANFIAARGVLRDILGRYLLCRPDQICFDYGPQGKPALRVSTGAPPLEFNVSHSHELALYAVTRGREVGLDIEYVREDLASEEIAQRFFSAREVAALRALPRAAWTRAFFNCWARKEAYIKATGK